MKKFVQGFNKGFTLIELLVVIAIIGILASVVLVSLNSARSRGADAAVKANLSSVRTQAELYYAQNGNTYGTQTAAACSGSMTGSLFSDTTIRSAISAATNGFTLTSVCAASPTQYAVQVALSASSTRWCVDSSGVARESSTALTGTTCP